MKKNCCNIEIIEIHDGVKVVLHYNKDGMPILIQYWNDNRNINEEYRRRKTKPNKHLYLEKVKELIKKDILELDIIELV
jgi:hypothetical protein